MERTDPHTLWHYSRCNPRYLAIAKRRRTVSRILLIVAKVVAWILTSGIPTAFFWADLLGDAMQL